MRKRKINQSVGYPIKYVSDEQMKITHHFLQFISIMTMLLPILKDYDISNLPGIMDFRDYCSKIREELKTA